MGLYLEKQDMWLFVTAEPWGFKLVFVFLRSRRWQERKIWFINDKKQKQCCVWSWLFRLEKAKQDFMDYFKEPILLLRVCGQGTWCIAGLASQVSLALPVSSGSYLTVDTHKQPEILVWVHVQEYLFKYQHFYGWPLWERRTTNSWANCRCFYITLYVKWG